MIKKIFILGMLLIRFTGFSQIGFEEKKVVHPDVSNPSSVLSIDVDGDGFDDILTSSYGDDKISWYKNIGGLGTFSEQRIISINCNEANSVYAIDIDNDGDVDVFSASNSKIAWYENLDGLGNFGNQQVINSDIFSRNVIYSADIDTDGDLDLISVLTTPYLEDNIIDWYENLDGLGTFSTQKIIATDPDPIVNISAIDINRDGDIDIISSTNNGKLKLYKGVNGDDTFEPEIIVYEESSFGYVKEMNIIDVDADGFEDLVFGGFETINLVEYIEVSDSFLIHVIINENASSLKSADFDGDGDEDLVIGYQNEISWYQNTGGVGNFGNKQIITNDIIAVKGVCISDFNRDGNQDVVSASNYYNRIAWYENIDGLGGFGSQNIITSDSLYNPTSQYTADLDGDGDLDVVASSQKGKLVWYKNLDGLGNFSNENIINTEFIEQGVSEEVVCADIDGDGDMDIVFVGTGYVRWYENTNGLGNFVLKQEISIENTRSVACADFDGDGDIDIVCGLGFGKKWYRNTDGQGLFEVGQVIATTGYSPEVRIADIDNDGYLDLLYNTNGLFNNAVWYKNMDGLGTFQSVENIGSGASFFLADIDDDGDIDVFSTSKNKTYWRENLDGQGNFSDEIIIDNHNFYNVVNHSIFVKDIDGDGDKDVIIASYSGIFWYENLDGSGTFGVQQIIGIDNLISIDSLLATDINGDGKSDVVCTVFFSSKVSWFKNLGTVKNEISGTAFFTLSNCSTTDIIIPNLMITSESDTETISTFTTNNGFYQLFPDIGNYNTTITSALPNYFTSSPIDYLHDFTDIGNSETANFCIIPNQTRDDLSISILPIGTANPGFNTLYVIVFKNNGTTQLSGNITLEFDNTKLNFLNSSDPVASQTGNSLTFNYTNLNPFETRVIGLDFDVFAPPTVNVDDVLNFTATINPLDNDETPSDNIFELNQIVVGSFDPNDIIVTQGDEILLSDTDKYLNYVIRFQNTGTSHAVKVRIHCTLDDKLDWETLQLDSYSHDNIIKIKNGNEIDFIFNAIYLSDSTDEPNSHGYIAFKIKPKNDVSVGDVFVENAQIYFDFNTAIETNTVTTEIVNTLAINDNNLFNFSIYPVPATNSIKINSYSVIDKIEIYNKLGQLVLENTDKKSIDISTLSQGIYFVKVKSINDEFGIKKIIKK